MKKTCGPYLVMRYGPLLGYTAGGRLTNVAHRSFSLSSALAWLRPELRPPGPSRFWIVRQGQPAHRRQKRATT